MSTPIPQPPGLPLIGNLMSLDPAQNIMSIRNLAEQYGEIFKLNVIGREFFVVSSNRLANELCDENRFVKNVGGALQSLRPGLSSGLFTAEHGSHDWEVAHRTLVPAFGPIGIKGMFDEMHDIASQLVAKWARMGPDHPINVTDDYTRLTLDTIALCAMDKRFNSFYSNEMHPFIGAMVDFLIEGGRRVRRTRLESLLNTAPERKFKADIEVMRSVAREVIAHRRANPSEKKDLLNAMLFGKDPKTGERLTDDNIMNNMLTFLIAGHETTSGMLSFASYYLMKNPETWHKAQEEVDRVIGKGPVKYEHMSKLPYLEAILRETLRLQPTAPLFSVQVKPNTQEATIIGGEYTVPAGKGIAILLHQLHRDPAVYGEDADQFKPERMYGDAFSSLPPHSWMPFGNGLRACIGKMLAWQESVIVLAIILQNFNIRLRDPSYEMTVKETLTIKPDQLFMYATLRNGIDPIGMEKRLFAGALDEHVPEHARSIVVDTKDKKPLNILYGSNSGTCEGLAQSLASSASGHGYTANVNSLDSAVDHFSTDRPTIIITASYEGNPPDNATSFMEWLKIADESNFKTVPFAVFGCGHRDWAATYQKVPTFIESELTRKGAVKILARGETNVQEGTIFDDFDAWTEKLWTKLGAEGESVEEGLAMDLTTTTRASHLHHNVQDAIVISNEVLTGPSVPEKRHMQFKLPSNMTYEAGDYLAILPINNVPTISRVLRRFSLPWDAMMKLRKGAHTTIPTEQELAVTVVLGAYVELNGPATRKNVNTLIKYGGKAEQLTTYMSKSVLDILELHPEIQLPFSVYLSMLTPMRIRQYSISSSPLKDATTASITFSVVSDGDRLGVTTNYLRSLQPGTTVQLSIKKSHAAFHLPLDDNTPIVMVSAGTGIAPMISFCEERATKFAAGKKLGEAALFVGCRSPTEDKIFGEQLEKWEKGGIVKLFYAYSRASEQSERCKYAQDRLWQERKLVQALFTQGARAYICGSGRFGKGVAEVAARIIKEVATEKGKEVTDEQAAKHWEDLRGERYAVDVFD